MAESPRILVLTKRQYMARDLLDDRYGRFRELPLALAASGARVHGLCLSYRTRPEISLDDRNDAASVSWTSLNVNNLLPFGGRSYWRELDRLGGEIMPDIVWACSDVPHAVLGAMAARRLGAKLVIDLYDNFESYPLSGIPGVNLALRRAVRSADGVTCISEPLARMIRDKYSYAAPIEVIENAIPSGVFKRGDKVECRAQFGLPPDAILIGTAGALSRTRGTECLVHAFEKLAQERSDVHLILAGALDSDLVLPSTERIHYLGLLPPDAIPKLLSALDISVVCNRDSAFGRYCFPQKLYESLACETPVAVARVGAMAELLGNFPDNLYEPENVGSLLATLRKLCSDPVSPHVPIPTWNSLGHKLGNFLCQIAASTGSASR